MRSISLAVLLAVGFVASGATAAIAAADAASVIAARKANMKKVGVAFRLVMGQSRGGSLDSTGVAAAKDLKTLSAQVDGWFPNGSGPDVDSATRAKTELWSNRADFTAKAKAFSAAAAELEAAAIKGGNVQAAAGKVGGTCKACHDPYREAY